MKAGASSFIVPLGEVLLSGDFYCWNMMEQVKAVTFKPTGLDGWGICQYVRVGDLDGFNQADAQLFSEKTKGMV